MHFLRYILVICLLVLSSACSRGPGDETLLIDIQQRMDEQFSDRLFDITKMTRKGSAPRLDGGDGIYVYYNLELEFLRDYNLISWRGLNVGTLAAVLGATTTSIEGFGSGGNKKGDNLKIRGRIAYYRLDNNWLANDFTPIPVEESVAISETLDTPSLKAIVKNIRELIDGKTNTTRSDLDRITLHELKRSLARIDLAHAESEQYHTFGTGWTTGAYHKFGEAFSDYANKQGFKVYNYSSEGSLENGYRLSAGSLDFALLQSDVAEVLYKGWIEEGQLPSPDLRAIASLWPEAVHVITLEKNGITNIPDIEHKRVAVGSLRSGTRFTAARLWLAAGFGHMSQDNIKYLSRDDSIEALEKGEVDVIVLVGAVPDPAIQDLSQRRNDIVFIPVQQTIINKLVKQNFAYFGNPIPAKTYPGQTQSVLTLGMAALLITNVHTEDKVVQQYMKLMQEGADEIAATFYHAGFITYKTVRLGISLPLHPAAKKYYDDFQKQKAEASAKSVELKEKDKKPVQEKD
jgi:TRAP transporter TAXI family solute receptor